MKNKSKKENYINRKLMALLLAGMGFRIILSFFGTLKLDFNTFVAWSHQLANFGFEGFYNNWSDYLPGYLYILWFLGKVDQLQLVPQELLYKLPAILSDLATGTVIYTVVSKLKDKRLGLLSLGVYIFNPAIFANSTLWGQADSLTALFSMLALSVLNANWILSAIILAFGTAVKPQAALALIPVLYMMRRDRWRVNRVLIYNFIGLLTFLLLFLPFYAGEITGLPFFVLERLGVTLGQYPYTSINAFNFWGLFGMWRKDSGAIISPNLLGLLFFSLMIFVFLKKFTKKVAGEYLLLSFLFLTNFMFFTRMHERHMLPLFAPLTIVIALAPHYAPIYFGLSLTYISNLYYSYVWIVEDFRKVFSDLAVKLISFLNLSFFVMIVNTTLTGRSGIYELFKKLLYPRVMKSASDNFKNLKISKKTFNIILLGILSFSLISRIYGIANPKTEYFDEVYHAFTAKVILHNDPKAWEWWNPHPEGFAYEWTHPPLAKEFMALSMYAFGEYSWAWRLPGVIFGVGAVFLIYKITRYLFKDELLAILSSGIYSLDGLPLVMSRIAMNDTYLVFFILLSLYMYLKGKNMPSALFYGLALSSKWSAIWAIPVYLFIHVTKKRKLNLTYMFFFLIPPMVYLASYLPMFTTGHTLNTFIDMQKQMWWYHTGLDATHPFTSAWYTWPFLVRPIWLYTNSSSEGIISNIYAMGNPFVFWLGFAAVCYALFRTISTKNVNLGLIVFSYLIFFVPWAVSPRIMFLYHYLPSIPFLAIILAYALRRKVNLIAPVITILIIAFIYFYPRYTGIEISESLNSTYGWFPGW